MTLVVDISCREPSYGARHGIKPEPYRWRYVLEADSVDRARWVALEEFRRIEAVPSVWLVQRHRLYRDIVALISSALNRFAGRRCCCVA